MESKRGSGDTHLNTYALLNLQGRSSPRKCTITGVAYPLGIQAWVGIEPRGDPFQHRKRIIIEGVAIIILYWKRHDSVIKDKIYRILIVRKSSAPRSFRHSRSCFFNLITTPGLKVNQKDSGIKVRLTSMSKGLHAFRRYSWLRTCTNYAAALIQRSCPRAP